MDDQTKETTVGALTNLLGRWWPGNYIDQTEQAMWESASGLAEVGELTALWLEGRIRYQPGYCAAVDVDEDEVPGLADLLAACCRAGFVTTQSQAAADQVGYDGQWWEQRAAVEGFADDETLDRLTAVAQAAGLSVSAGRAGWRTSHRQSITVTTRAGRHHTGFGALLSRAHIADDWLGYGICQPAAVDELIEAWQVLVYDPAWGNNDRLWPALVRFAEES